MPTCKSQNDTEKDEDKYEVCYYCSKKIRYYIGRHFMPKHAEELEMKEYFMVQRTATESEKAFQSRKKSIIVKLRMLGNFKHNLQVSYY